MPSLMPQVLTSRSRHISFEKDPEHFCCSVGLCFGPCLSLQRTWRSLLGAALEDNNFLAFTGAFELILQRSPGPGVLSVPTY